MEEHPVLFFINQGGKFAINNTVCVDKCPKEDTSIMKCARKDEADCESLKKYSSSLCLPLKFFISNFSIVLGRVCWPTDPIYQELLQQFKLIGTSFFMKTLADLKLTWWMVPLKGLVALILG